MRTSLETRLRTLPPADISPEQVLALADLAPADLAELLADWRRFTPSGLETLEALSGVAAPNRFAIRFEQAEHHLTGIDQQSALTFVSPEIGFICGGDDSSALYAVKPSWGDWEQALAVNQLRKDDGKLDGIEGARFNPRTGKLRVISEDKNRVWELGFVEKRGELRLSKPEPLGKIDRLGKSKNKGIEGIDVLPAALSPDKLEWQLAVNEGRPRKLAFIDPDTLTIEGSAEIPESLDDVLPDLSDLAVSPRGTLFLLSDEGNTFVELAIRKVERGVGPGRPLPQWTLVPLATTHIETADLPLAGAERLQPEGLSFDHVGNLWVACEANGVLIRFTPQD